MIQLKKQENEVRREHLENGKVLAVMTAEVDDLDFQEEKPTEDEGPEVLKAWMERLSTHGRDWNYLSLSVRIYIETGTNWVIPPVVGKAHLGGIESDHWEENQNYRNEMFTDLLNEAKADAMRTLEALESAKGFLTSN